MTPPPDIIVIILDTQRADRLGCYGYDRPISPNLDAFAAQSTLFAQAISPAQWTIPSHASLFTGLYPTAHQLTQSNQSLSKECPLLGELLAQHGYETVGFCNNPLVGILNNGLKRGFQTFYNYGGAIPTLPKNSNRLPWPLDRLSESYTQFLRRISYPVQNFFGQSELAFSLSLTAWLTPLWSRLANFKGQNERSVRDVGSFLQGRPSNQKPLFLFLNLMETHLPFTPPKRFAERWSPDMMTSEGQRVMRRWNRESFRWGAPLAQPLSVIENRLLNDMYDAEVAYQDNYLAPLLAQLQERENTLTIILSDHGDGLGEHGFMGHAFSAYQELVHVPLICRWPGEKQPNRIQAPVSSRRIYHTILESAGILTNETQTLSLKHIGQNQSPEKDTVIAEIYPPLNFVRVVADRFPELLEPYRCRSLRRAIVAENMKLIAVDDVADELFDLQIDPHEVADLKGEMPAASQRLSSKLHQTVTFLEQQKDKMGESTTLELSNNKQLLQRLRGLGYIE